MNDDAKPPYWPPPSGRQPNARYRDPVTKAKARRRSRPILIGGVVLLAVVVGLLAHRSFGSGCPFGVDPGDAAWAPNGKAIAFVGHSSSGFHIYSLSLATRHATRLTNSQCGNEVQPSWSPNGKWLAYTRSNDTSGIYLVRANGGGGPRKIIPNGSYPAWSPDGTRLAYVIQDTLYTAPVAAPRQAVALRTGNYQVGNVTWSPDGKWIAFAADTPHDYFGDNAGVGVVSARGGRVRLIDPGSEASGGTWSPNSKWIAYEVYSNLGPSEIRIASRAGAADRSLRDVPEGNAVPAWSPRGATIAIYWYADGSQGRRAILYLVGRDGRDLRRIYSADVAAKQ
jgi:Tol biopolymer transport system component